VAAGVNDGVVLQVLATDNGDLRDVEESTLSLRGQLLALDVDAVEPLEEAELPERAKGLRTMAGWLVVHFGSAELLQRVVACVADWANRNRRSVEVSFGSDVLKLTGATPAQQEKIIEAWLARHSTRA
jgi:hypothetical protein